ncbi:hypothetical protein GUJ93_ZPchr0007g3740 [Zizania palustris]|uniref:peroxidase n=1 Tax=Zizania palustris TaxID=103762 RepID=A0A8J5TBM9_ZIZPA|nr:hypothetical protein GUJ93_ZPchr0007g3740 [Zizania palustris]
MVSHRVDVVACCSCACALLLLMATATAAGSELRLNFYLHSCPRAEIVREQVRRLYEEHGNTAVSWTTAAAVSEQASHRSFGMRNFKYIATIKAALERECPATVSCADVLALAARDGVAMLGGPSPLPMRTGRRDSRESYYGVVEHYIPNHNDSVSTVLSRFAAMGVEVEGAVALLGAHSVGRVHCFNLVGRLYPTVDGSMEAAYGKYLRGRCPEAEAAEDTREVVYARNDRKTPMLLDNMYYRNLIAGRGLLLVDQRLASDPRTAPYVRRMAADNAYFHHRFAAALLTMSENAPLTGAQGEVRKHCSFLNYPAT